MSRCTCGVKSIQPEHHKFGCPYRHPGSMAQYTTPRFEDKNVNSVIDKASTAKNEAQRLKNEAMAQLVLADDWIELGKELLAAKAATIAELPEDRQRYWKFKLDKPVQVTL